MGDLSYLGAKQPGGDGPNLVDLGQQLTQTLQRIVNTAIELEGRMLGTGTGPSSGQGNVATPVMVPVALSLGAAVKYALEIEGRLNEVLRRV